MSAPQWKPGDVALVSSWRGTEQLGIRVRPRVVEDPLTWCVLDSSNDTRGLSDDEVTQARPLVVVDPDSPADQRRILDCLRSSGAFRGVVSQGVALDCIGDALRSLVADPNPDEPQGLDAVVEDATGGVWVRSERAVMNCWTNSKTGERFMWHKVAAVRVLSEGWSE